MNKKSIVMLGVFWILVLSLVTASSVACGFYWGDSVEDPIDDPVLTPPSELEKPIPVNPLPGEDPDSGVILLRGFYWGD